MSTNCHASRTKPAPQLKSGTKCTHGSVTQGCKSGKKGGISVIFWIIILLIGCHLHNFLLLLWLLVPLFLGLLATMFEPNIGNKEAKLEKMSAAMRKHCPGEEE